MIIVASFRRLPPKLNNTSSKGNPEQMNHMSERGIPRTHARPWLESPPCRSSLFFGGFTFELDHFRDVVQPDHPEHVNMGRFTDSVELHELHQARSGFRFHDSDFGIVPEVPQPEDIDGDDADTFAC